MATKTKATVIVALDSDLERVWLAVYKLQRATGWSTACASRDANYDALGRALAGIEQAQSALTDVKEI